MGRCPASLQIIVRNLSFSFYVSTTIVANERNGCKHDGTQSSPPVNPDPRCSCYCCLAEPLGCLSILLFFVYLPTATTTATAPNCGGFQDAFPSAESRGVCDKSRAFHRTPGRPIRQTRPAHRPQHREHRLRDCPRASGEKAQIWYARYRSLPPIRNPNFG